MQDSWSLASIAEAIFVLIIVALVFHLIAWIRRKSSGKIQR
jgi:NADH:ubiquinone oxidoreductase subunit H